MKRSLLLLCAALAVMPAVSAFSQTSFTLPEPDLPLAAGVLSPTARETIPAADPVLMALLWGVDPGVSAERIDLNSVAILVQAASTDAVSAASEAWEAEAAAEPVMPAGVLNNPNYRESLRYKALSVESFDYGDYDASAAYAAEAMRHAQLSDEYIAGRVEAARRLAAMAAADEAIAAAKTRLDWARKVGADKTYPRQFSGASSAYDEALAARAVEDWYTAIAAARRVLSALAEVREFAPLPARYTVRPWAQTRDCFWNIAGYSWVYGDPTKWRLLYEANRTKLRRPDNPDLLHVGIILDIPSIAGEVREGLWVSGRAYAPLPKRR